MFFAEDFKALHQHFLQLASHARLIGHRSGIDDMAVIALECVQVANIFQVMAQDIEQQEKERQMRNVLRMFMLVLVFSFVLLGGISFVWAQEATEVPVEATVNGTPVEATLIATLPAEEPEPGLNVIGDVPSPNEVGGGLLNYFKVVLASVTGGALVTALAAAVKRAGVLKDVPASLISLIIAAGVVLMFWGANYLGLQAEFVKASELTVAILTVLLGGTAGSAKLWYSYVLKDVPFLGTSRNPPPKPLTVAR